MISSVITIVLTAIILRYVLELEQKECPCSLTWQHKFIKSFAPVVLVVSLLTLLLSDDIIKKGIRGNYALGALFLTYLTFAILYGITLVLYFLKLRYSECKCAHDWKQYGLLYPIISFAVILLLVIIINALAVFGLLPKAYEALNGKKPKGDVKAELLLSLKNNSKAKNNSKGKK